MIVASRNRRLVLLRDCYILTTCGVFVQSRSGGEYFCSTAERRIRTSIELQYSGQNRRNGEDAAELVVAVECCEAGMHKEQQSNSQQCKSKVELNWNCCGARQRREEQRQGKANSTVSIIQWNNIILLLPLRVILVVVSSEKIGRAHV